MESLNVEFPITIKEKKKFTCIYILLCLSFLFSSICFILIFMIISEKQKNDSNSNSFKCQAENNKMENLTETQKNEIIDSIYPVGSYYISSINKYPGNFLVGDWEQITDRFLVGAGDKYEVNSVGGEEKHLLTIDEMPQHDHSSTYYGGYFVWGGDDTYHGPGNGNGYRRELNKLNTGVRGGNKPHNNIPPYYAAYIWKRIK